jgi:hypothetical protein
MQILEKFELSPYIARDHSEVFVKDMDLKRFENKFPVFSRLANKLRLSLPNGYKHYLVDLIIQEQRPGMNTCRDVRWHLDGDYDKDNQYVLWVRGPNRTVFPEIVPDLSCIPEDRNEQSKYLEELMKDKPCFEVPYETLVRYNSKTPHKGVVCKLLGKRTFIRMMATNYIKPKMIVKEKIKC